MHSFPFSLKRIQIEPTNRCNCSCVFCRRTHWQRKTGDMSLYQFKTLLKKLPPCDHIHLQGQGEPLLNENLSDMIRAARENGVTVGTSTDASLLAGEKAQQILESGITRINVSLDTVDPERFIALRPGASLKTILENIDNFSKARDAQKNAVVLAIAVVAMHSTIPALPQVVKAASDLGADEVFVQNLNNDFLPSQLKTSESCLEGTPTDIHIKSALRIAEEVGIKLLVPPSSPQSNYICSWPHQGSYITWDGYVVPCCLQPDPDKLNFGNIFEMDFTEIWGDVSFRKFREEVKRGEGKTCQACPDLTGQMWHPKAAPF